MLAFLAAHVLLFKLLTLAAVVGLVLTVLRIGTRGARASARYQARHRSWRWSTRHGHEPRHAAPVHHPRHVAVAPGPGAYLGRTPDGELALVDDEHTHELIGATA
jgi:hypothetical protein